jgi:hypothetical protein
MAPEEAGKNGANTFGGCDLVPGQLRHDVTDLRLDEIDVAAIDPA